MKIKTVVLICLALTCVVEVAQAVHNTNSDTNSDKILLRDVQVLTFQKGQKTTGRRNAPIEQLICRNCHTKKTLDSVTSIQCKNVGFDGRDVNWECNAVLDKEWVLGKTEVNCEGYDYPDDPYVLVGSCAVEFELKRNPSYAAPTTTTTHYVSRPTNPVRPPQDNVTEVIVLTLLFGIVIFSICWCWVMPPNSSPVTHSTNSCSSPGSVQQQYQQPPAYDTNGSAYDTSAYDNPNPRPSAPPMYPSLFTTPVTPVTQTTRVDHVHHIPVGPYTTPSYVTPSYAAPSYSDGLATGMVTGLAMGTSMSTPTVIVQPVQQRPTETQVIERVERIDRTDSTSSNGEKHTSTAHATTKRR